jgi:hypothetical protein
MPRKRVHPNTTFKYERLRQLPEGAPSRGLLKVKQMGGGFMRLVPIAAPIIKLTDEQRRRLARCVLPRAALPRVEALARRLVNYSANPEPTNPEKIARLESLRKKTQRLRKEIADSDPMTVSRFNDGLHRSDSRRQTSFRRHFKP